MKSSKTRRVKNQNSEGAALYPRRNWLSYRQHGEKGKGEMYKFLRLKNGEIVSEHGTQVWEIGKKYSVKGEIQCCHNGFHASDTPLDALNFVKGEILAIVEGGGGCDKATDKSAWRAMQITKAYKWKKADSVALAIFCAEQVIGIYEAKYPNDKRPRNAIDVVKKWLAKPTDENRAAAYSAACAARAAAYEACSAADSAADAADAADAAYSAACAADAARAAAYDDINAWIITHIAELEEIKCC